MEIIANPRIDVEAKKDILDLQEKIQRFRNLQIDEEKFKQFRLTRGVYGQRQQGVHMFRTKIPYGRLSPNQLRRLADVSDEFATGNLHLTTRQNIQFHYVKLEDSPLVWARLEEEGVTSKEACGNTVRNITASPTAGVDPEELFDVSSYVQAVFEFFLRHPVCQEMGRKIKIAFSSSKKDSAFTYFHDFGFIPALDESGQHGFEVFIGGGLGAQPFTAVKAYDFLPANELIPFIEAGLRVFDRYGEREKRYKARMKYLIDPKKGIGLEKFLELVGQEKKSLPSPTHAISYIADTPERITSSDLQIPTGSRDFELWLKTNTFEQKQRGFFGVYLKVSNGDLSSEKARMLADIIEQYAAPDLRLTINQGILLRFVKPERLLSLYHALSDIGLADYGYDTLADVTACPGTDTCNLAVTNSTKISLVIEEMVKTHFPHLIEKEKLTIKISGCMNSCGQHMAANIGLHGSSIKNGTAVIPALQVVIGGGVAENGQGFIAEKVIKLPTKRIPDAIRLILNSYIQESPEKESFNAYFQRLGNRHFYQLLKHLADKQSLKDDDYLDWGHSQAFVPEIGTGECAGVSLDVIATIIGEGVEKVGQAQESFEAEKYSHAIYFAYSAYVIGAKALLLEQDIACNSHDKIITDFQVLSTELPLISEAFPNFEAWVLTINQKSPEQSFASDYLTGAQLFIELVKKTRELQLKTVSPSNEKLVISNFYKA
ncbi:MAG: nitrite/sulfite reductase [Cyclobacteriaceae bacterium]